MNNEVPPLPAAPDAPMETSLVARLTNVFVAPGEVFAEVKASPVRHANWLVAALIFVLLSWCAAGVMFTQDSINHQLVDIQEQAMQKKFQKNIDAGKMTQAQADQIKAQVATYTGMFQVIGGIVGPVIVGAVAPFLGGFILWAVGTLIFRKSFAYLKAVEVSGLTLVVAGLGALVKGLICAAMGTMFASPGLVLLVKPYDPTNLRHMFLLAFDVFAIWGIVLSGLALAKLSGVSFVKAFMWVCGISVIITGGLLTLGWAVQRLTGG